MKIEIEISDQYAKILSNWASVGRTLTTAVKAAAAAAESDQVDASDAEMFRHCFDELTELMPAIDHLHYQARQAMWNIKHRERAVAELEKSTPEQRKQAIAIMNAATNPQYHEVYDKICGVLGVSISLWPEAVIDWLKGVSIDA